MRGEDGAGVLTQRGSWRSTPGMLLDVAPEPEFVMTRSVAEQARCAVSDLFVARNWGEELRRLVPVK